MPRSRPSSAGTGMREKFLNQTKCGDENMLNQTSDLLATVTNVKTEPRSATTIDLALYRIARGDESAMARFYNEHHKTVYAFAKSRLHNQEDAAEIVNEVMMEVWRSAEKFENRSKLSTWLLGIAYHKVVDKIRKVSRHQHDSLELHENNEVFENAVADVHQQFDDKQLILNAMKQLNQDQQQVVYLAFYQDMGYPEIAKILGCPEGTVKTRMMHAKKKIKKLITETVNQ